MTDETIMLVFIKDMKYFTKMRDLLAKCVRCGYFIRGSKKEKKKKNHSRATGEDDMSASDERGRESGY